MVKNLQKLLLTACAFCLMKNQEMVAKAFFMNVTKNNKTL